MTDENGTATTQFRIRSDPSVEGTWWAIASVDISCTIVWDTVNFTVFYNFGVGGHTTTPPKNTNPTPQYITTIITLALAMTLTKRKLRKK